MKTTKITKLLAIALSCALLIAGILCISAFANDESGVSADFKKVTLNYGADTRIAYALEINGADASDVALYLYDNAELAGEPHVASFSGSYYNEVYPVYYSHGISAKDLADYVYATPVLIADGEAIGDACRYSVAQYCYSVLMNTANDETLLTVAEDLLAYGASAQARLIKIGNIADETLVTEYNYVYTAEAGVVLDGKYGSTLVAPEATFVPSYTGEEKVLEWLLTTESASSTVTADEAAEGLTVTAHTKVTPVFFKPEGFDGGALTTDTVTTAGTWSTNTAEIANDPKDATNNVLKVTQTHGSGSGTQYATTVSVVNPEAEGNTYTFEAKFYLTDLTVDGVTMQDLLQMMFVSSDGQRAAGYGMKAGGDGSAAYLNLRHNVTANASIYDLYDNAVSVKADQWYTVRYELYATGAAETYMTKIYIGQGDKEPVCVAEVNAYTASLYTDVSSFKLIWQKWDTNYTVYLDDVSLVKSNKEFVTSKLPAVPEGFNNEDTDVYTVSGNRLYTSYTAGGTTPSIAADPTDSTNNVLKIQKIAQSVSGAAAATTYISAFESETDANCYTYSSKIYFGTPTNTGDTIAAFIFNSNAKVNFNITYGATGTIYMKNVDKVNYTGFDGNALTLSPETWYEFKLELYVMDDGSGVLKIYLGTEGEDPSCVGEAEIASVGTVSTFSIAWEKNKTASAIYLDGVWFANGVKPFVSDTPAE